MVSVRDLANVIDALHSGVVVIDAGGTVREMNGEACRILGSSAEAGRRRPVEEVLGPLLAKRVRSTLADGRGLVENEIRIQRRHAPAALVAEVAIAPFRDPDGRADGVVLEIRDRSIHQELIAAESQRHRIRSFGRIAAGIAHEVKNPLGGIRGAGELVAKRSDDPRMKKAAELVIRESDRISALLDDFMVLGEEQGVRARAVNLHRILDDVLDLNDLDPLSDGVEIRRLYDPSIPELLADRDRLAQVFHNLVRNALQCMAERDDAAAEKALEIRTRVDLDHPLSIGDGPRVPSVSVEVQDSGPGIPESVRDKITVPFFTTRTTGTGLGLAIAQHWVTAHRGRLVLESEPGHGTLARVTLPLHTARSTP
ncbi:MAG: PAS domain-containing protein [Myxococcales bacterium]|nr:PAS domain-containing protein [Myxococcales bacterium]